MNENLHTEQFVIRAAGPAQRTPFCAFGFTWGDILFLNPASQPLIFYRNPRNRDTSVSPVSAEDTAGLLLSQG